MKINITKVKKYDFTGYVSSFDLTPMMIDKLNLIISSENQEIAVEGSFSIQSSYDDIMVYSPEICLTNGEHYYILSEEEFNIDDVCDDISEMGDHDYWHQEIYERAIDDAYDRYTDR